jgi:flagellar protein FliS
MRAAGYQAYQRVQAETSSPGELVVLLYDALLTDLQRADAALRDANHEAANARLVRAQEIVLELNASLDRSYGELPEQLGALYGYAYRRMLDANVRKDRAAIAEVDGLLRPLRDAWRQAVLEAGRTAPRGSVA